MARYEWGTFRKNKSILDTETDYVLLMHENDYTPVFFERPSAGPTPIRVTGRSVRSYDGSALAVPFDKKPLVAEVGCGLGGWLEWFVGQAHPGTPRPIAVDDADFTVLDGLLEEAKNEIYATAACARLHEWQSRIRLLQDPSRVDFYNTTFERFVEQYADRLGALDFAVDNHGFARYGLASAGFKDPGKERPIAQQQFRRYFPESCVVFCAL